jgi:hypothetical protein
MIVVRNIFQLKFGLAKDAKQKMQEGLAMMKSSGIRESRVCMDMTGPFYTMVLENTYDSLSAFEATHSDMGKDTEWPKWYASFSELVESGHREIYSIVE